MIAFTWGGAFDVLCWLTIVPALGWAGYRALRRSAEPAKLIVVWAIVAVLALLTLKMIAAAPKNPAGALFVLVPAVFLAVIVAPAVARFVAKPLTDNFTGGDDEAARKPFYYLAEGKRRQGLLEEAIAEIRKQLEQYPGDAAGCMMLATIQAEDLHDIGSANGTLEELLAQPSLQPQAAVAALHAMADWQLQFGQNTPAARAALERVVKLFPNSQYAHAARQRLAHLGGVDETREFREKAKFEVQTHLQKMGLEKSAPAEIAAEDAEATAAEYVKQLAQFPADTQTREKLAVLYAEQFQRLDLAADQLEQLIALPEETPKHVARWLNLLATLHIRCAQDRAAAEDALRRIVEKFPDSSMAEIAAMRVTSLALEFKAGEKPQAKRLGVYEKDLGLKKPGA
ncbi:MAG: tetratricopeptide repeat protein [Limisphaerales bacterium]